MTEPREPLTVERDIVNGGVVASLRVAGEVDLSTVAIFDEAISASVENAHDPLRIDLSGVTFMDSSGLNALIRARNTLEERGVKLVISGVSDQVRHLLEISGLATAFVIAPE